MHSYAAFGTQLNSVIELPELVPATEPSARPWTLDVDHGALAPTAARDVIGAETVYGSVQVRLRRGAGAAFRLEFDDTGAFDVDPVSRAITWHPGERRDGDAVRADILGRVMAVAAHADGALTLHASAVAIGDVAVAFLGPKHAGKSTVAMALLAAGARLLTDDTLVVRFSDEENVVASPGVQRVRLWPDSLHALGASADSTLGTKPTLDTFAAHQLEMSDIPLAACYVLRPVTDGPLTRARREPLSPTQAALACVSFSKLGALLGSTETAVVLDRAVRVARSVSFHVASVPRDLGQLRTVAADVLAWHGVETRADRR